MPKKTRSKYIEASLLQITVHDAVLSALKTIKKNKNVDDIVRF